MFIPELNLEQAEDCEFEVRFWTTEKQEYKGIVTHKQIKEMTQSELMGFNQGIIVEMDKEMSLT